MTTCAVDDLQVHQSLDDATRSNIRSATYAEFLYGYGASPGVDLGTPRQFSQPLPGVFQQRFDRGLTIANVRDEPVQVELAGAHWDLEGRVLCVTVVAPHSAEVLRVLSTSGEPALASRLPSGRASRTPVSVGRHG